MDSSYHQFFQKTGYDTAQYLASLFLRTLHNQVLVETAPLLPQLFNQIWNRLEPSSTASLSERFIEISVHEVVQLVSSSCIQKVNELLQLDYPVPPPSPGGYEPSPSNERGYEILTFLILGAIVISLPVSTMTTCGLLTAVGGMLLTDTSEREDELVSHTKKIINERIRICEERCVKNYVEALKEVREFEDVFGKLFGINFDERSLSLTDELHEKYEVLNNQQRTQESAPGESQKNHQEDNDFKMTKIFTLSVSIDPDHSTKTYFIISTLVVSPPNASLPPSPHHFRVRFSTLRGIYLKLCSLSPSHDVHYNSFPSRTYLPCYEKEFLVERGRGVLGWLRVCESDEKLHDCLSEELMKFKDESRIPALKIFE